MSKNAIVTGADGNLGNAVVNTLLSDGFKVAGTYYPGNEVTYDSNQFQGYSLDVTEKNGVEHFVKEACKENGDIKVAALLVGGFGMGNIRNTTTDDLYQMYKINFETAFTTAKAIFEQMEMQPDGGHIVFISAKPAIEPEAGKNTLAYSLSKSQIVTFADIINAEGKNQHIKASVIFPSIIDTPPNRQAMPDADFEKWPKPQDIADTISFIASEKGQKLKENKIKVYGEV